MNLPCSECGHACHLKVAPFYIEAAAGINRPAGQCGVTPLQFREVYDQFEKVGTDLVLKKCACMKCQCENCKEKTMAMDPQPLPAPEPDPKELPHVTARRALMSKVHQCKKCGEKFVGNRIGPHAKVCGKEGSKSTKQRKRRKRYFCCERSWLGESSIGQHRRYCKKKNTEVVETPAGVAERLRKMADRIQKYDEEVTAAEALLEEAKLNRDNALAELKKDGLE